MSRGQEHQRENEAIPEQTMLRALVDGTSDAVYVKDTCGRYLLFNPTASLIVGQPAEAVLGKDDTALFPEAEARTIMAGDRRVLAADEVQTYEEVVTDAEGKVRTFLSTKGPIRDPDGAVVGIFGIARDITALREAEAAKLVLASRLHDTMDGMLEGCQIIDRQWRYVYLNDAAVRHSRRTRDELIEHEFGAMWPGVEGTALYDAMRTCMETGVSQRMENEFEYPDGQSGWFDLDIQSVPEGVFVLSVDITERKVAEQALTAALARLRAFVDSNIVGVILATSEGAIVETNDYYLNLIGRTREEFEAGLVGWRAITPAEWLPSDEIALQELQASGRCTPYEKQYLRPDGSRVWVYLADVILPGPDKFIAAFAVDITDRKRAEAELDLHRRHLEQLVESRTRELDATNEELQATNARLEVSADAMLRLNRELLEATQAKSQFLTSMSHELRTPLNSIIGFSDLLYRGLVGELTEEQHKQVGMIHLSGQHLLSLINDVLDLSRIEAGAVDIDIDEVDVRALVLEVAETLRPLAAERNLDLRISLPDSMHSAITDAHKVKQILLNLGGNAIKFTDSGHIEIHVTANPDQYLIEVSDTGAGIAAPELSRIFDEFAQIDQANRVKPEGTGLGLAISRRYAELLGGRIDVTSTPGVGSTFTLALPADLGR